MADNIDVAPVEPVVDNGPDLATLMSYALGTAAPPAEPAGPTAEEPVTTTDPVVTPFSFDTFKEKFGYQTPEEAEAEISALRALKANPPAPTYEFANEDSKRLLEAWAAGKEQEVFDILEKKVKIERLVAAEVTKDNAAEIVKYGMQLKYKDLSQPEIDYKFKKQFAIPPKPLQRADEEDDEYQSKVAEWQEIVDDKTMELMIEAKTARPEIEAAKSKLVLPEINQQVDPAYLEYKKSLEESTRSNAETAQAYKAFTPKSIETKLNFNDEANGIAFDFQFEPDAESFNKAIEMTTDIDKFYDAFHNQDGTPDRGKFLRTIYNAMNIDKLLTEAMKQAKNATIKSMLPDNTSGGMVRQLATPPQEMSEMDKYMRAAGIIK